MGGPPIEEAGAHPTIGQPAPINLPARITPIILRGRISGGGGWAGHFASHMTQTPTILKGSTEGRVRKGRGAGHFASHMTQTFSPGAQWFIRGIPYNNNYDGGGSLCQSSEPDEGSRKVGGRSQ